MKIQYFLLLLVPFFGTAQTEIGSMNRWSVGASVGAHDGMAPTAARTRLYQIHHFGVNTRYMVTNRAGLMLDVNYDFLDFIDRPYNSYYVRTSLQGVVNAGDMLHFNQVMPRVGLLAHGGFGMSHLWSNNTPVIDREEDLNKRSDEMINFIFGVTPQLKLNDKWSLNTDLSFIFHSRQNNRFDMQGKNTNGAIDGYLLNLSIGASYYFGKNKTHADWTPTIYGGKVEGLDEMKAEIAALKEQTKDDDRDGVPNVIDKEANTPEGSFVDSDGVAMKKSDKDNDGIDDAHDVCPDAAGLFSTNGCPDSDKDGVADKDDACPQTAGSIADKGCPQVSKEVKEVMTKALKGVQFDTGKSTLLKTSFPVLDDVVKVMMNNPQYNLEISGHTDNAGDATKNLELSEARAQTVATYLKSKGISADRITAKGFGATQPKASNDTPQGQAINRRVEFNVLFN